MHAVVRDLDGSTFVVTDDEAHSDPRYVNLDVCVLFDDNSPLWGAFVRYEGYDIVLSVSADKDVPLSVARDYGPDVFVRRADTVDAVLFYAGWYQDGLHKIWGRVLYGE